MASGGANNSSALPSHPCCLHSSSLVFSRPPRPPSSRRNSEPALPPPQLHRPPPPPSSRLPSHLQPFLPFLALSTDIDPALTGISADQALIFCPSLLEPEGADLPVLPEPTDPSEDLPFLELLRGPEEPRTIKRYRHPALERRKEEEGRSSSCECRSRSPSEFLLGGRRIPPPAPARPTSQAVREKALRELEMLMQGIAVEDSSSPLVLFQADLNRMQQQLQTVFTKITELRKMLGHHAIPLVPVRPPPPPDTFGVRRFLQHHHRTMSALRQQYADCVREMAKLEAAVDMGETGGHFAARAQEME